METEISERVSNLKKMLVKNNIKATIIPTTDPHLSEYSAKHWKLREWISGFTGSAGTAVITEEKSGVWTDSRYFIQGENQLKNTPFKLYKEKLPETPSIIEFIISQTKNNDKIGIDGKLFSVADVIELRNKLESHQRELATEFTPINDLWEKRPLIPKNKCYEYEQSFAGETTREKIEKIRNYTYKEHLDGIFISSLDDIAWTLNLRGKDVLYTPVSISYLLITAYEITIFIDKIKIDSKTKQYLLENNIKVIEYYKTFNYLSKLDHYNIGIDPKKTNYSIYSTLRQGNNVIFIDSPIARMKAVKNKTEINAIHTTAIKDGLAIVKFEKWLEESMLVKEVTEREIDQKITELRSKNKFYIDKSFETIVGYKEHGAIVHYIATEETNAKLKKKSFVLIDSGAQYLDGTTDITRTIPLGELTYEERKDYTLVLKGHINLAMSKFPKGTRGCQLDSLARMPLWKEGVNYLHGTGHGVGHFLSVHEGPQSIRMEENPIILEEGMLTSNEPGIYKEGKHGIRIENLMLVNNDKTISNSSYLNFETITLCPISTKPIIKELLNIEEINWLNNYHLKVYTLLKDHLNKDEAHWLKLKTENI